MRVLFLILAGILAACSPHHANGGGPGTVVTLYGQIQTSNRAGLDPSVEPLFNTFGLAFDEAYAVSDIALENLPQHAVEVDYPAGDRSRRFSGPLLRDVLALAQGAGDMAVVTALDGYQREIAMQRIADHDVILATRMDDAALPMGGFGPAMLIWPRRSDPALAGMPDDDWLWGVVAIEIR